MDPPDLSYPQTTVVPAAHWWAKATKNLLYDTSQLTIPTDVDPEQVAQPTRGTWAHPQVHALLRPNQPQAGSSNPCPPRPW
jgi:hypothetical protein